MAEQEKPTFTVGDRIRFRSSGRKATVSAVWTRLEDQAEKVQVLYDEPPLPPSQRCDYVYSSTVLVFLADKRVEGPAVQ